MRNRAELWLLDQVAQAYSSRPSAILGVEDGWLAYQVDVAAWSVGQQAARLMAEQRLTPAQALARLEAGRAGAPARRFRDPRPMVSRTMRVPTSGVW